MAFEKLKNDIGVLIAALDDKPPEDKRELQLLIHEQLPTREPRDEVSVSRIRGVLMAGCDYTKHRPEC